MVSGLHVPLSTLSQCWEKIGKLKAEIEELKLSKYPENMEVHSLQVINGGS